MTTRIVKKSGLNGTEKTKSKLRVAAYCRVSTFEEVQESSFELQVETYEKKIRERADWQYVNVYADRGISGTREDRPSFQAMIEDCEAGKIDLILTKSISRFSRNVSDLLHYVQILKALNVNVIFEEEHIELASASSNLLLSVLGSVAQMEVENLSSHIQWSMDQKKAAGEAMGTPPLGYDAAIVNGKRTWVVNEEEAVIIKRIFSECLEGKSLRQLCLDLERDGMLKRGKKRWYISAVAHILHNEVYTGKLITGKSQTVDLVSHKRSTDVEQLYVTENAHEAIISKDDWDTVQALLDRRTTMTVGGRRRGTTANSNHSCFTSKIRCAYCGAVYTRHKVHYGRPNHRAMWACSAYLNSGKGACARSKMVDEEEIKRSFLFTLNDLLSDDLFKLPEEQLEAWLERKQNDDKVELEITRLSKEVEKLKRQKETLLDRLLDGTIDSGVYKSKSVELDRNLSIATEKLAQQQAEAREAKQTIRDMKLLRQMIAEQNTLVFDEKVFAMLVDSVTIGGKSFEGNDEPRMITFHLKTDYLS